MEPDRTPADDPRSDSELLGAIAQRSVAGARQAQAIFYRRHIRYLYGILLRHQHNLLPLAGLSAEDLAQDTFRRAFDRAQTFDAGGEVTADRLRLRARAWLGRIATNLLRDRLRESREISASPYLEEVGYDANLDDAPASESPGVRILAEGLEQLSERERDVLRVTALFYRAGEHQRLPNNVSRELCERWQTSNENIRAIRVRALKKLKAFVLSMTGDLPMGKANRGAP